MKNYELPSLYLRMGIGASYLWEVADRFGIIGKHGSPHVGWGDWKHFLVATAEVINFIPQTWVPFFAALATFGEFTFGLLLIIGFLTRYAALGSGVLALCFALSMTISSGIDSPLGYSVFTLSAASFLLYTLPSYKWSLDSLFIDQS